MRTTSPDSAVLRLRLGHKAKLPRLVSARVPAFITFIKANFDNPFGDEDFRHYANQNVPNNL